MKRPQSLSLLSLSLSVYSARGPCPPLLVRGSVTLCHVTRSVSFFLMNCQIAIMKCELMVVVSSLDTSHHTVTHTCFFFFSQCDVMRCNATLSGAQNYAIPDSLEPQSNGACAMIIEKMSIAPMHCGGFLSWIRTTFNECNVLQRKAIRNR